MPFIKENIEIRWSLVGANNELENDRATKHT